MTSLATKFPLKPRSKYYRIKGKICSGPQGEGFVIEKDTIYFTTTGYFGYEKLNKIRIFINREGNVTVALGYGYEDFGKWYYQHLGDRYEKFREILKEKMTLELEEGWHNLDEFKKAMHPIAKTYFEEICEEHDKQVIDYERLKYLNGRTRCYGLYFDYDLDGSIYEWKTINFNLKKE